MIQQLMEPSVKPSRSALERLERFRQGVYNNRIEGIEIDPRIIAFGEAQALDDTLPHEEKTRQGLAFIRSLHRG